MATAATTKWEVTDAAPKIGSLVHTDKQTLLSGEKAEEIRELMERRGVLVFPEINLTDEEQIAFTHTIGTFAHEASEARGRAVDGGDFVYPISMDPTVNPHADYLKGAFFWHLDGTMSQVPIRASIMSSRKLSPTGGETEFCNTYAAWDDLPEEEKAKLEKKSGKGWAAVHLKPEKTGTVVIVFKITGKEGEEIPWALVYGWK